MLEKTTKECQICKKILTDNDDVVVCPICGAPHHRECYNELNHCGVEVFHGTENQYDLVQNKKQTEQTNNASHKQACPHCKRLIDKNSIYCSYCGSSLSEDEPNSVNQPYPINSLRMVIPDGYGGVDRNAEIDGVSVKKVKKFIGPNSQYYLPRFFNMIKSKVSWNWPGFLFPYVWLFYRKMYKEGFLTLLVFIASAFSSGPIYKFVTSIASVLPSDATRSDLIRTLAENITLINPTTNLLYLLGLFLNIAARIIIGLFGNYLYKNHCISTIKSIESNSDDTEVAFSKKGLANPFLMILFFFVSQYLFQIIMLLF